MGRQDYSNILKMCGPCLLIICLYTFAFFTSILFSTRNASLRSRLIATCHRLLPLSLLRCSLVSGEQPSLLSLLSSQFHRSKKTRMTSDSDCKSTSVSVTLISYNFHSKDLKILFFFFQPTMFFPALIGSCFLQCACSPVLMFFRVFLVYVSLL